MKISIHDYQNNRSILAEVPQYLIDATPHHGDTLQRDENIAQAILTAIGITDSSCEYMIGDFDILVDVASLNSNRGYPSNVASLEELTNDFKEKALAALAENE